VAWDRERYRREVLEPARQSRNVPPTDLSVRYDLRGRPGPSAFTSQVAAVTAYWHELDRPGGRYQQLAIALLTAHADLERDGPLTPQKLSSHQDKARTEQTQRLARMAQEEARSATHADRATVQRLAKAAPASEAEVVAALGQAGVKVVDAFPALPAEQHPKQADLAQNVRLLGLRLSAQVPFGDAVGDGFRVLDGFRLADGRRLDEAALRKARDSTAKLAHTDPARAPAEKILAILSTAARRPGDLDQLMLSEVVERLRSQASPGFSQHAIAQEARDLGLDEDEAGLVAGALLTGEMPRRGEALRTQAAEALEAGRLRSAQRLARELPPGDPLAARIAATDARVAALTREADEQLALGRRELAAGRLADALEMAGDDPALAGRLVALPPPPPRNATATPNGQHVVVTWESSLLLAGRLRFLVARGQGSGPAAPTAGTAIGAPTARDRVVDEGAPTGAELCYSVFACYAVLAERMADASSVPAVTKPVMLVADVTNVKLNEAATAVTASWRPPHGAHAVVVRRGTGDPPLGPGDGTPVQATLTGFTDTGLATGTEYLYRIMTSYRASDGSSRRSPGIVVTARPAPEPEPVTDLTVTVTGDRVPLSTATWTPPPHGEVRLVASSTPPAWSPGQRVTAQLIAGQRHLEGASRRLDDGRDALVLSLPPGRHYLVPLTVTGNRAVAGDVAVADLVAQVHGLVADRVDDRVRLAWEWPPGATDAVISWAGGACRRSKREYTDEGGVAVTVGPAQALIEVRAVYPHSGGPLTAPAASVTVPARPIAVRYRIYRGGVFRRRRRTVEFFPERETRMPAVLVVQSAGRHPPDDPSEGEALRRIEPQAVAPERRLRVTVDVRKGPGWLACFTEPAANAEVLLFPPPVEEMMLR
jgi:hypothetical protein